MNPDFQVRPMRKGDIQAVIGLQAAAFPHPFSSDLHWSPEHLEAHLDRFPSGQWVAEKGGVIVASCSNTLIAETVWSAHLPWSETVGGPFLSSFAADGSTLYGLDIAVHPDHRRKGVGKALYACRFEFVRGRGMARYGTACRLPGYARFSSENDGASLEAYLEQVVGGNIVDHTLTPLLRIGLDCLGVVHDYMEDEESGNAAALLEWRP